MDAVLAGLGLGFSLIIAIGAQNVFVLRQGVRREWAFTVAAICTASDMALIGAGILGLGALTQAVPWLDTGVRWAGAAFLVGYGLLAARRAIWPSGEVLVPDAAGSKAALAAGEAEETGGPVVVVDSRAKLGSVVLTALAITWLNPHVYLDTVFLIGSVGASQGERRWAFAAGAMVASAIWFFSLTYAGRFLGRWLSTVRAWRWLDGAISVVMVLIGVSLVFSG